MVKTGATARPVDKLNPGKLNVESKVKTKQMFKNQTSNEMCFAGPK